MLTGQISSHALQLVHDQISSAEMRSNTITALHIPAGHTYASLHDGLKARGFVVYEGQGKLRDEVFRIANMGHLGRQDFERCLVALREVLRT